MDAPFIVPSNEPFVANCEGLAYLAVERATVIVAGANSPEWRMVCQTVSTPACAGLPTFSSKWEDAFMAGGAGLAEG